MCPSNDKEISRAIRIDPFLHSEDKFKKTEVDRKEAEKVMQEGIEKAKTSRIDIIGQNGGDGDHYDK